MRRGDLVSVAMPGDFAQPRPALVIQSDRFAETATYTVLLVTGTLVDAPLMRPTILPTESNGLRKTSQVMIDKAMSIKKDRCGSPLGRLDDIVMTAVTRSLAVFLGLA